MPLISSSSISTSLPPLYPSPLPSSSSSPACNLAAKSGFVAIGGGRSPLRIESPYLSSASTPLVKVQTGPFGSQLSALRDKTFKLACKSLKIETIEPIDMILLGILEVYLRIMHANKKNLSHDYNEFINDIATFKVKWNFLLENHEGIINFMAHRIVAINKNIENISFEEARAYLYDMNCNIETQELVCEFVVYALCKAILSVTKPIEFLV